MKFPEASPVVVGSVTTPTGLRVLARKQIPAHAVEVRVDALLAKKVTVEEIEAALKTRKHPVVADLADSGGGRASAVENRGAAGTLFEIAAVGGGD